MYKEIENVLIEHPEVAEVCVVALHTFEHTDEAGICLVLRQNAARNAEDLEQYCRGRIPHMGKVEIRILPSLPKGPTGMVARHKLIALF